MFKRKLHTLHLFSLAFVSTLCILKLNLQPGGDPAVQNVNTYNVVRF